MSHASRSVHRQSRPARVGPVLLVYLAVQTKARRDVCTEIARTGIHGGEQHALVARGLNMTQSCADGSSCRANAAAARARYEPGTRSKAS